MARNDRADAALISALREGKHEALTEIFHRYWKSLYYTAFLKLRSHELAEEIVQDLFTQLWDKRDRLFGASANEQNLASYLHQSVKNKVLNYIRKQVYDKRYWEYCRLHMESSHNSTHELAEFNDLQHRLEEAVDQLSSRTKEIFVLHKLKGVPVVQISKKLKLSEKAVGYHLTKSVRELKVYLKDFI